LRLEPKRPHLSLESFGTFPLRGELASKAVAFAGDGIAFAGSGIAFASRGIAFECEFSEREESLAGRVDEHEFPLRKIEADAKTGTDPAVHRVDFLEPISGAIPTVQLKRFGVINIIFLDPVPLVKLELLDHLR
jgi:hypothetical protein